MARIQNIIKRHDCPKCGTHMLLFGLEPDGAEFELRSFECAQCAHIEIVREKARVGLPVTGALYRLD